jgi:hypothetical protein
LFKTDSDLCPYKLHMVLDTVGSTRCCCPYAEQMSTVITMHKTKVRKECLKFTNEIVPGQSNVDLHYFALLYIFSLVSLLC